MIESINYKPIGIMHSQFKEPKGTPIQPSAAKNIKGIVEVFTEYEKGLKDIDGFSHIILIYHFHLTKSYSLEAKPFMDNRTHGVFATRAPARPNPIGLSVVRLIRIEGKMIFIKDVDIVDGTPLLDIKPFLLEFDHTDKIKKGWLTGNINKLDKSRDDGRFSR